jgi:uncharacterized protein (DUF1015 family)
VHLELKDTSLDYAQLAGIFQKWCAEGVFENDVDPCLYLIKQDFEVEGKKYSRRGMMGQLKLTGDHKVHAHEKTHSGPKEDRKQMLRHMKANISPNFIIYRNTKDEPCAVLLKKYESQKPCAKVFDDNEKVDYTIWRIADKADIAMVEKFFEKQDLMIADGHHRTEVATKYFLEDMPNDPTYNYMMSYLSPIDENLLVFPTHRVLTRSVDVADLMKKCGQYFSIEKKADVRALADDVASKKVFAFGFAQAGEYLSCTLKDPKTLDAFFVTAEEQMYKGIDSFLLHNFLFAKVLGITTKEGDLKYTIRPVEAEQLAKESSGCVFLMKSTSVEEVMRVAVSGFCMPQKTTYFFPKVLSGLTLRKHELQK